MNFVNDVSIEETALDVECLRQPRLMLQYSKVSAEAEKELALTKRQLDLVRAELDKKIRLAPQSFGVEKITETAIMNTIISHPEYKKVEDEVIQAQYNSRVAKGAVEAIQQKKDMLEALIRLHGQQYFAGPKVPRDLGYEWRQKEMQKVSDEKVAQVLSRGKK